MKTNILSVALHILVASSALSEIKGLQFEPRQFDERNYTLLVSDAVTLSEPRTLQSQSYDYCLKDKASRFEIRYILFSQNGTIENAREQVFLWATMVILNAVGYQATSQNTRAFTDDDVRAEFNADYGITSFGRSGRNDFTEGYKYVMTSFFYKEGIGIACQAIMLNDTSIIQTDEFMKQFHSFRFN